MKKVWVTFGSIIICGLFLLYAFQQKAEASMQIEKAIISQKVAEEAQQKIKTLEADLIECQLIAEQSAEMAKIAEAKLIAEKNKK